MHAQSIFTSKSRYPLPRRPGMILAVGLVIFGALFFGGAFLSGMSRRHADSTQRDE